MSDLYTACELKEHVTDIEKIAAQVFGKHGCSNDAILVAGLLSGLQCQIIGLSEAVENLTDLLAAMKGFKQGK